MHLPYQSEGIKPVTDRPVFEDLERIEVTPEMIRAALDVMWGVYDGDGRYPVTPELIEDVLSSALRTIVT